MRDQLAALTNHFTDAVMELVSAEVQAKLSEALRAALGSATSPTVAARRAPARKAKPLTHANGIAPKGGKIRKPKPGKRAPNTKRTPEEIQRMKDQLLSFVSTNAGKRAEEIQTATGIPTSELALPLKLLVAEKAIRHEGVARGTRYFAR